MTHVPQGPDLAADERQFLRRLVAYGFLLRVVLAVGLHVSGYSRLLAPDEITYVDGGVAIAQYWAGELAVAPWRLSSGGPLGYFYVNGAITYLLGPTEIPIKLINSLLGALTAVYAYRLARQIFDSAVARRSATLVEFLPSLVLWSVVNIRDVWVIFLILFISCKSQEIVGGRAGTAIVSLLGGVWLLTALREYLFWVVAVPPIAAFVFGSKGRIGRNFVLALLAGLAILMIARQPGASTFRGEMSLEAIAEVRQNMALGGSAFAEQVDISTPGRALAFLPTGLAYFFFSPFPWQITTPLKALTLPEMLLLYYLTPRMIRGIRETVRYRFRAGLQILLVSSLLACCYALVEGNVGTLYRHRAQAISFFLIFAAVGIEARRSQAGGGRASRLALRVA